MEKNALHNLYEFINTAERNRNYATNTAIGRRAALRLFETELNEHEKESISIFITNLDRIYNEVFQKNKQKMSALTLQEYKRRITNTINDYEKYGLDPTKMATWRVKTRGIKGVADKKPKKVIQNDDQQIWGKPESIISPGPSMIRTELPIRTDVKVIVIAPSDLTEAEAEKLKTYFEFLSQWAKN